MFFACIFLRVYPTITLIGLGSACRTVVEICDALKREKLGEVHKIKTEYHDDRRGNQNRSPIMLPKMSITICLFSGKNIFGQFLFFFQLEAHGHSYLQVINKKELFQYLKI